MCVDEIPHGHFVQAGAAGLGHPEYLPETCMLNNKANQ